MDHPTTATGIPTARRHPRRRRGVSIVYVGITLVVLIGFCSMAVDLGRVQTAKTEVERACDAAARAGAGSISGGVTAVQAAAAAMALDNTVDGTPLVIDSVNDVVFLNWPSKTPLTGSARAGANAIQVTASRAVPLLFLQALGVSSATVHGSTTATIASGNSNQFQVAGVSTMTLNGNNIFDSYNSSKGSYMDQSPGNNGTIASNVEVKVPVTSTVDGNVYYYTTKKN